MIDKANDALKLVEQIAHPLANTRGNNKKTLQREWGTCIYHASTKWFLTWLVWPAELRLLHLPTFRLQNELTLQNLSEIHSKRTSEELERVKQVVMSYL